jgi:hypothetical protein
MDNTSTISVEQEVAALGTPDSLYNKITRRIRACGTIFGEQVKLVVRVLDEEHWALMNPPYLLVIPVADKVKPFAPDQDQEFFTIPRMVNFIAQLDGQDSECDWKAADQIELAEKQLCLVLVNWHPDRTYGPTVYNGMKVQATRAPAVRVAFSFTFLEQIVFCDETMGDQGCSYLNRLFINVQSGCPCPPPDPCYPCEQVPTPVEEGDSNVEVAANRYRLGTRRPAPPGATRYNPSRRRFTSRVG